MTTREFVDKWELDTLTIVDIEASDTLIARIDERDAAFRTTVAAALRELRAKLDSMMFNERHKTPFDAIQKAQVELDATIIKLGLADEVEKEKCT